MNLIVIVTDSLRYDHVGCCGGRARTPKIDAFANEAMVFDQAYSENLPTMPCRTAWWTGRHLFTQRGWQHFEPWDYLLAEVLWDKGFTSALVTDVYHMHKPVYNCGRGFDTTVFVRGQEYDPWVLDDIEVDATRSHRLRGDEGDKLWGPRFVQYLKNTAGFETEDDYFVARVVNEACRWLDHVTEGQRDNLFLWVDCFDPHEPWDPPEPYRSMYDPDYQGQELIDPVPGPVEGYLTPEELQHTLALYAGEVTFVDKWVGVLLDRIRDLGLWDNSLIMFTSDHGEPFGEHGIVRKALPRGYEELAHIPWIVRAPVGVGAGQRCSALVQPPDLMPTVLDLLGIPTTLQLHYKGPIRLTFPQDVTVAKSEVTLHGKSLVPLLRGEADRIRDFAVTAHHRAEWTIRTDDWTFMLPLRGDRPPELYDRRADRCEQANVVAGHPGVADALELTLRRFAAEVSRA